MLHPFIKALILSGCIVLATLTLSLLLVTYTVNHGPPNLKLANSDHSSLLTANQAAPRQFDWRSQGVVTAVKDQGRAFFSLHPLTLLTWMRKLRSVQVVLGLFHRRSGGDTRCNHSEAAKSAQLHRPGGAGGARANRMRQWQPRVWGWLVRESNLVCSV